MATVAEFDTVPGGRLRVISVCTGNLCRSPTAEQLLRARLDPGSQTAEFTSAGTMAGDGEPMHPRAATWSEKLGGDPGSHRSAYLTPKLLGPVDLALGMDRQHRRSVVGLRPAMIRATFTLVEFARLAAEVSDAELEQAVTSLARGATASDRLGVLLPLLARSRSLRPPPSDQLADDVIDPIGRGPEVFEQSARQIDAAVDQVVRVLKVTLATAR